VKKLSFLFLFFFIFVFSENSFFKEGKFKFIEKNSGEIFSLETKKVLDTFYIFLENKNFKYLEKLLVEKDSVYILKRYIKGGFFSFDFFYYPKRLRFVLPFEDGKRWFYVGKEKLFFYERELRTEGFVIKDGNNLLIFNVTRRDSKIDTSITVFDESGFIKRIFLTLPQNFFLMNFLKFKTKRLDFSQYE